MSEENKRLITEYFCTVLADNTILPLLAEKSAEMAHGNRAANAE